MENQGTEDIELVGLRNVNAELYQRFRVRCAEKKINYGTGFEQAINSWLVASSGDDLLSQPPFDTINPNVINEFRSRCKRHGFDILPGIADAMVVWIRNYAYTDPYPWEDKGKVGKKKRKV
ncbi:hypothetical protein METP3_02439 [Methanosarcinales archaeon]|nr:hypothetical protein METP3_02439 [Methanosarcinales archaeon]